MKKNIRRRRLSEKEKGRVANRAQDRFIKSGVVIPDVYNVLDPTQVKRGTSITPIP
jgi:hypothetical protein